MTRAVFLLLVLAATALAYKRNNRHCRRNINAIDFTVNNAYCEQPLFVTFVQRTEENLVLDNVCYTYFPLPDDPETFQVYEAKVYCDGSLEIASFIGTVFERGVSKYGSPYCTYTDTVFGYAGCDTYLVYRCFEYGDCDGVDHQLIFGVSSSCTTIGLSCLRKVEEIVDENKIKNHEYIVLPMKLPNKCVTQQLCLTPENPFFNHMPGHRSRHEL
ncbi:uncharacterized protein LOC128998586 [Macrosteles quadrilineatus]|uniref:uncharacterized protein LOC128998586 n=1 Tax=Macrosteles quadrilineatus TaxID=74068 RepID=UPI0023E33685|nr:uncharacterized protein LOC128998586 [Macrosteles quadrilineatus]XP_054280764.1 uncharacterized protein LOC128998586 [Macrosteles quadrilineatus]